MKLILDTNVIVAGVRSRTGASNLVLIAGFRGQFVWSCSLPLFYEYEDVLNRPEFLLATGLSRETIGRLLNSMARVITPVEVNFRWRPQLSDPVDEMALEAAINARAEAIVTLNARAFGASPARFGPGRFGIEVLAPADALRKVIP